MKVLINRAALVEALGLASSVVLSRTPKPVLTCVKIVAGTGTGGAAKTLTVVATDMELALQYTLTQVDIASPGVALIPASKLSEIVNNSPDDTLTLDTNQDTTVIKGSDAHYKVFGYNAEEFPPVSSFDGTADFSLTAGSLRQLLDRTRFAAAREMTRYAINGVLFEKKGKKLSLVATDGHRLAMTKDDTISDGSGKDVSAVVPIKAINLIERLLTDPEQTVALQFKENKLFVQISSETGGVSATMSTSLVEGTFPPYGDVIPKDSDKKVTLNRERFFSAVRRAALLTNEESKGVRLAFSNGTLSISSRAPEMGEAKIDLPIDYTGESIEIGFNPTYLLDALKVADQETVTFEMKTPNKPGLLKSGPGFLYVVMPVNLS
ncbi:MAG TPA: DNA polymerase III subunit beta [Phycisphaerae bacterium]|nr:DNA polymerase III subunit beta [Phycisphaerae bacterium]